MNTISNNQSTIDVYALKRVQETKALEQSLKIKQMLFKVCFNLEASKFNHQVHTVIKLDIKIH